MRSMITQPCQRAIASVNPLREAASIGTQGLMKESPPEIGNWSVVWKYRGGRLENKRPRVGNLKGSQQ
ncbi:hypothetical protein HAX54_014569, partial [Datura stramonium]|nr:hypothetical protein [Datura stramonium]